jgi:ring-1,2-phenylacetyl-CoA epoxidase subunit PaaD
MTGCEVQGSATHEAARLEAEVWSLLGEVPDPEIPVLNVVELGLIRYVRSTGRHHVAVGVSPTYTGCPATEVIQRSIRMRLQSAGFDAVDVTAVLTPPWSSDWLTDSARAKLLEYGIAPPAHSVASPRHLFHEPRIACPRCAASRTERISEFGSTPCKALYRCIDCREPFEYFKCI